MVVATVAPVTVLAEEAEGVKILSTTPEDGSTGITPMGTIMEVEFNTPIDPTTLTTASISSEPAAIVAVVPDKTKTTRCTVYFSALELNTKYKVMFSKQIKAQNGERLKKTDVVFQTTSQYPQHHQIVNGDMENTDHLNMFELAGATTKVISYQKEDSNTVLKFNPGWAGAGVGQHVYVEPGKTYEMRAKVKSTTSQMVRMIMSYVSLAEGASNWWHPIVTKTLQADQWVEFSGTVTIPDDLSYDHDRLIRITAQVKSQVIYIDDMQFFETGYDIPMPKIAKAEEKVLETYFSAEDNGEIEQLVGLGIFEPEILEKADSKVSRLDAAIYMGRIAGVVETSTLPTSFLDMEGVRKRDAVQSLVDMGVMKGFGKYFYPNNNISVQEVLESMVNLLGYKPMVANFGYSTTINNLKLNRGVQRAGAINYSDFAKILVNALDADVMEDNTIVEGKNLLWKALKVKKLQGVVSATEYTNLYGDLTAAKQNIVVDGVSYKVTSDTYGLEGKKIRFFTKEIDNENFILYITKVNSLNNVLKLDWDDISEYSDYGYTYFNENNKSKKVVLAPDKKLIYNGVALDGYTTDDLDVDYGSVELIDNNMDGVYDVVRVENIATYIVKAVDQDNYIIYDEHENEPLDLSSAKNIIVEENGKEVRFGNILPGSVVSAARSKDGSFAKLYISNTKLESSVGRVYKEGTVATMDLYDYIHGAGASKIVTLHPFYKGTEKARENGNAFMGQNVVVMMDHMGYVVSVAFGVGTNSWYWGYIVKSHYDPNPFAEKMEFKLFDEKGNFSIVACAKKVNINGTPSVERKNVLSALKGGDSQLIRYKKNANDEIVQILSDSDDSDLCLKKISSGANLTYSSTLRTFGYKAYLSSTSIPLISVPEKITDDNEYQFIASTASEYLLNEKEYTFDAYSVDDNDLDAEFLVLKDQSVQKKQSWNVGMVMDIRESLDENGEFRWEFDIKNTGSNYTALVYPDRIDITKLRASKDKDATDISKITLHEVRKGDIIVYQNNSKDGFVENMLLLYSRKHDGNPSILHTSANPSNTSNSAYRAISGTVKKRVGDLIRLLPTGAKDEAVNYNVFNTSLYSRVLVYDSSRIEPHIGTKADVYDENLGSSEVVIVSSWGGTTLIAVYK